MNDEQLLAELGAELDRRADRLPPGRLTLADVQARAGAVRRRRRAAGALAVAAVAAAVLVPLGLTGQGGDRAVDPATSPRTGDAVLAGDTLRHPDGTTVTLPLDASQVSEVGVLTDGRVVVMATGARVVTVVEPDGTVQAEYPVALNDLTMGQGDDTVAWVDDEGTPQVLEAGQERPVAFVAVGFTSVPGGVAGTRVDAVLGTGCADGGCEVLAGPDDRSVTNTRLALERPSLVGGGHPMEVTDVSPDGRLWAGVLVPGPDEQFGCAVLYDPAADRVTARSCDTSNLEFSPDGAHVLGWRGDNNMVGEAVALDLDLREVRSVVPAPQEALSRVGWADSGGLLVVRTSYDGQDWRLSRLPLEGPAKEELIAGPVAGPNPELGTAYLLSE
ncbi:hypothetical protein [Nocardioides ochotonae]|uniref:hypothetical protein n=1 Tax=Nocardioides ochotonae TaxID=2685869 RepID=UPI00140C5AAD|nr:hypothetical protein [Nocardioides ochotonae]